MTVARLRLPAYGRELADARHRGYVPVTPTGWLIVTAGWRLHDLLGTKHPHLVVDDDPAAFNFKLLAGLDVLIVHEPEDREAAHALGDAIWRVRPRTLTAAPVPCEPPDRYRYWHPEGGDHV